MIMSVLLPPVDINKRTVKGNLFSKHDNRHTLQSCGEYFGQGLGKRLEKDPIRNQHHSDNHTSWGSKQVYSSTYKHGYSSYPSNKHRRALSATPLPSSTLRMDESLLKKYHTLTKPNFRRFPLRHSLPENFANTRSEELVSSMLWYSAPETGAGRVQSSSGADVNGSKGGGCRCRSYTTPLSVIAASQQPYLGHNPWRYSYKQ